MSSAVLLYGYGNPGRLDDGLGPALARELAARHPAEGVTIETGYQLQVESGTYEVLARSGDRVVRRQRVTLGEDNVKVDFVTSDGTIRIAAACAGDITRPSRPIATVGRPSPITPLTTPASRLAQSMARGRA